MPSRNSRAPRVVWLWRAAVGLYVGAMYAGTHLPVVVVRGVAPSNDKALHFGAYCVLGLLLGLRLSRPLRTALLTLVAVAAWAALDELSQPLVGRSAELLDGLCDVAGAATGLLTMNIFARLRRMNLDQAI